MFMYGFIDVIFVLYKLTTNHKTTKLAQNIRRSPRASAASRLEQNGCGTTKERVAVADS